MEAVAEKPVVFIDGYCVLCDKLADLIIRKDSEQRLLIATLQGETFNKLKVQLEGRQIPDSVVLYYRGEFFFRSVAVLKIMGMLPFPYNMAKLFRLVPGSLADMAYNWLAGRRYGIFGQRSVCRTPTHQDKGRFLD